MPYIKKEFKTIKGKKIEEFLTQDIPIDSKLLLTLLEKGKITDENNNLVCLCKLTNMILPRKER